MLRRRVGPGSLHLAKSKGNHHGICHDASLKESSSFRERQIYLNNTVTIAGEDPDQRNVSLRSERWMSIPISERAVEVLHQ
jgi:hypothetical protein